MASDTSFFEKITPSRRRINAEETAKGYRLSATAEGDDFIVKVNENDTKDVAKAIASNLGAALASMIIETRREFKNLNLPLAIPDNLKFIEDQNNPHKVTPFTPPRVTEQTKKIIKNYDDLKKHDVDKESGK